MFSALRLGATALVAMSAAMSAPPAQASNDVTIEVRPQPTIVAMTVDGTGVATPSAAFLEDVELFLASDPTADVPAQHVLEGQEQFGALVASLQTQHADTYVGAALDALPGADAWIAFTERPSDEIIAEIATMPLDVEVQWGHAATEVELVTAMETAFAAMSDALGPSTKLGSFSVEEITLTYSEDPAGLGSEAILELASRAAASTTTDGLLPVPLSLVFDPELQAAPEAPPPDTIWGGANLRLASNHALECTSGFVGTRNGEEVLITARHCENPLHFGTKTGWIQYGGYAGQTATGNWIDMQWHREYYGAEAVPMFRYYTGDGYRTVTGYRGPVVGDLACHWGATTGYSCGQVASLSECVEYDNQPRYCGIAAMDRYISDGGDSGGPWFVGTTALGIHSGFASPNGPVVSVFTSITMAGRWMDTVVQVA